MSDLNLPFEGCEPQPFLDTEGIASGGVVVLALTIQTPHGPHPAVAFRFSKADGSGLHPPVVLLCDEVNDLAALPGLVKDAVDHAITICAGPRP